MYIMLKEKININLRVQTNAEPIRRATTTKYLGIHLDSNLRFDYHLQQSKARAMTTMPVRPAQVEYSSPICADDLRTSHHTHSYIWDCSLGSPTPTS